MLILFTDFGVGSPYLGQMKAVLHQRAPGIPIIDLHADAPCFNPSAAAYLLAAYAEEFPPGSVFLCVVDPGVGDPARLGLVVQSLGRWYVGPDNGLLAVLAARNAELQAWRIDWRPARLSNTFHGRDWFAPVAARLALGKSGGLTPWPEWRSQQALPAADAATVIYQDHYGNLFTGLRFSQANPAWRLELGQTVIAYARTYSATPMGTALWYENAVGLVEIAIHQGSAAQQLGVGIGDTLRILA